MRGQVLNGAHYDAIEPRAIAPERTSYDDQSLPCPCGATPLLTEANGQFYMSCPPCWVRTHKVTSAEAARRQWSDMLRALRRFS